ncbi:MAG: radical SAM protein [Desulfobacterota bacterium]|nr:radical SAM protein [Thermodesulfobacteriota bacterium]
MFPFQIERIYLDEQAEGDWVARRVLSCLPSVPVVRIRDKRDIIKKSLSEDDPIGKGKRALLLTRFYGRRLKPCPGTSNHLCCGYYVINAVTNCPMDCSYCVLQGYLNNPFLTLYTNWDDLLQEIEGYLSSERQPLPRLGTGELSDSLALEPIFPISRYLVSYFAERGHGLLELKTKSDQIDALLDLDHRGRTVVSWSLTPPRMIQEEERGTASLERRLEAARRCQEAGYPIGLHFDPMIEEEGWEKAYEILVSYIFDRIDPKRVIWISMGGFRYPPRLRGVAEERFPRTRIFLGESFPGKDGKLRYLRPIRVKMYRKMVGWLREVSPDLFVYLCMESQEVWQKVFGWFPLNGAHLNRLFEERSKRLIGR